MTSNYRNKKTTTRVTKISATQLDKLRATRIKNAKSYNEIRFLKSNQFKTVVNQQIKLNRVKKNVKTLNEITNKIAYTKEQKKSINSLFGEKTAIRNNKVVKVNTFTSKSQTVKLNKILKQINKGDFNIKKYLIKNKTFQTNKINLSKNVSVNEILTSLNRTEFYYENKELVMSYNSIRTKKGEFSANATNTGKNLQNKYRASLDSDTNLLLEAFFKK